MDVQWRSLVHIGQVLLFAWGFQSGFATLLRLPARVHMLPASLGFVAIWAQAQPKDREGAFYRYVGLSLCATYFVAAYLLPYHTVAIDTVDPHRAEKAAIIVRRLQSGGASEDAAFREWWFHKSASRHFHCGLMLLLLWVCVALDSQCYQAFGCVGIAIMTFAFVVRCRLLQASGAMRVAPLLLGTLPLLFACALRLDPRTFMPHKWLQHVGLQRTSELRPTLCRAYVEADAYAYDEGETRASEANPLTVDIFAVAMVPLQFGCSLLLATFAIGLSHYHRAVVAAAVVLNAAILEASLRQRYCQCGVLSLSIAGTEACIVAGVLAHAAGWLVVDVKLKEAARICYWIEQHDGEAGIYTGAPSESETAWSTVEPSRGGVRKTTRLCAVCIVEPSTHAFYPCGHRCVCEQCSEQMMSNGRAIRGACPICREPIMTSLKIFDV